jgi:hypothetical protein
VIGRPGAEAARGSSLGGVLRARSPPVGYVGHNGRVPKGRRSADARALTIVLGLLAGATLFAASAAWSASTAAPLAVAARGGQRALEQASRHPLYPLPAGPVAPAPCPPPPIPPRPPPPPLGAPKVRENAIPVVGPPPPRRVELSSISGKGIWLTLWPGSPLDVPRLIATAHAERLHQLWVRTGSSQSGFYGAGTLAALIPAAHAAGIAVIAWDFPTLSNPRADAQRVAAALGAGADGFGADIESASEGTYLTARRVAYYASLARAWAGDKPLVAIVPRPTSYWLTVYPYQTEASFVDAFAPMVYWSCTEPGAAVSSAILALARLRPVAPIGQDYNMASEGGRHGLPSSREIWRFLDVAHRSGAIGASLYDLEAGGDPQLAALGRYPWSRPRDARRASSARPPSLSRAAGTPGSTRRRAAVPS